MQTPTLDQVLTILFGWTGSGRIVSPMRHYTPYQKKVIQRYYEHQPNLQLQQLSELVTDLYLADESKQARLWKRRIPFLRR